MLIINAIFFGFIFRVLGGAITKQSSATGEMENAVPRYLSVGAVLIFLCFNYMLQPLIILPMFTAFCIVRILPTQALLSAINGKAPFRSDSYWQFLQDWTFDTWRNLPEQYQTWKIWAIIYGAVRCSLLIPLAVVQPWLLAFLGLGLIYYAAGKIAELLKMNNRSSSIAEISAGVLFGLMV